MSTPSKPPPPKKSDAPKASPAPPSPRVLALRARLIQSQPELKVYGTGSALPSRSKR